MKYINLLITMALLSSLAMADNIIDAEKMLDGDFDQRVISSEPNSSNPAKPEDMKCYPISTVKRWAKRKKKAAQPPVEKIVEKIVEKKVTVDRIVKVESPRNTISILGGRTETGLTAQALSPTVLKASTTGEFDMGLMYQRRFGQRWTASVIATKNGSFYGGLGYSFNLFGE